MWFGPGWQDAMKRKSLQPELFAKEKERGAAKPIIEVPQPLLGALKGHFTAMVYEGGGFLCRAEDASSRCFWKPETQMLA